MTLRNVLSSGLAGICLLALSACTSDNMTVDATDKTTQFAKADQKKSDYIKPGAGIEFSHTYDGKTEPGEIETFQVFVKGGSIVGGVDVKMDNPDGLKIYSDTSVQKLDIAQDAPDGLDHTMNISIGAQEPGRYYLKFIATSDQGGDSPMMRAYAIAIQVGDQPYVPGLGNGMTAEETPTGEKIITMEAKETIEN
ncbi:MAG: hypothetical protein EX271_13170 [Acidimicrobiales bacterium]|nr:hypothetical protein [Hyphomonadaceae bacterium]RZV35059.1 MAG: hypothetical protein EX271_13170 [Acidimicrobiales bacterium]